MVLQAVRFNKAYFVIKKLKLVTAHFIDTCRLKRNANVITA